jgi:CDP-diacylglycerol--serine O-phosphatidyltransferase
METLFPPFEPETPPGRRRFRAIPPRILIPNLITLLALCAGMTAIRLAIEGRLELAVGCIVAAAFLDGIDGRLARYLEGTSQFGAELDSLADFVNFGVVPALTIYFWGLHDLKSLGWIVSLVFAMCMVLRLARFNVMLNDPSRPAFQANFFVGMPAPAGALVSMLPIYLDFLGLGHTRGAAPFEAAYVLLIAFLTASRIPTFSGKKLGARVSREWVLPVFVLAVALVLLLIFYPWETLTALVVGYLVSIPVGLRYYRRLEREHRMAADEVPASGSEITPEVGK